MNDVNLSNLDFQVNLVSKYYYTYLLTCYVFIIKSIIYHINSYYTKIKYYCVLVFEPVPDLCFLAILTRTLNQDMDTETSTPEEQKQTINSLLKKCLLSSPVYGTLKRQLAELLFQSNETLQGIVHLVESLGANSKFDHLKLEQEYEMHGGDTNEDNLKNIDFIKVIISFLCNINA